MPEFFAYDPLTQIRDQWDYDEMSGTAYIRREQDVSKLLDYTAEVRNTGAADAKLKDDNYMCCYAMVPIVIQADMLKTHGVNFFKADTKTLCNLIDRHYPYLKTTGKVHG